METNTEQMNAAETFCPNAECITRGEIGQGNIVIHGRKHPRYKCKTCGRTFSAKEGTMFAGLRKHTALIVIVVALLAYVCPVQAIVHAFELNERTVARWRDYAGSHCEKVHKDKIEQGKLDMLHIQADEIWVKARGTIAWMGLAMMVPTRLWIAGVVSQTRDRTLADHLLQQVRRCIKTLCDLLICTDGWSSYPNNIKRAFREKIERGGKRGICVLGVWSGLHIGTVIKRTVNKHLKDVIRQMSYGSIERAMKLFEVSNGSTVLNTSYIERLNGTLRERLASLMRKCRHASEKLFAFHTVMYLIGCSYNFCWYHQELSKGIDKGGLGMPCTPAMASGLTDHQWSIFELLSYKVVPSPFSLPKRRGRPRTKPLLDPSKPNPKSQKARVRLHKGALCSTTR